jgi:4a-hydroxytetrahydrobiopterin dehydratase
MTDNISPKQFHESDGTQDWRVLGEGAHAFFPTTSFAQAAQLVNSVAGLRGIEEHQPDVDVRPDGVTFRLLSKSADWYGMTTADVDAARSISRQARQLGLKADTSRIQSFLVVAGGSNTAELMPFWQAVLGYDRRPDSPEEDLVDPRNRNANFWFEQMKELRADGGGAIHVAVWIPVEHAQARVDAALAAGGHVVRDQYAPMWWTLADAAGNEVDVSTVEGRD